MRTSSPTRYGWVFHLARGCWRVARTAVIVLMDLTVLLFTGRTP